MNSLPLQPCPEATHENARILIIDDEEGNIRVLDRVLKKGGFKNIRSVTDSRNAIGTYAEFNPDILILDLKMPHVDGFEIMDQLKSLQPDDYLSILVLTAQRDHATRIRALDSGAKDFLDKPFELTETLTRIRNMVDVRLLHNRIKIQNQNLEKMVRERTRELEKTRMEVIHRLGCAAEYRDNETGMHVIRMSHLCARLAAEIGMSEEDCQSILVASPMHDVGKIGIPDEILLKPGPLSESEWKIMKLHPIIGAEILSGSSSNIMQMAETIALTHQERWNGSGYPYGLHGEQIPPVGRVVALCDVFDALTSERPYKEAFTVEKSMQIIEQNSGIDFEPHLVEVFKRVLPHMVEIAQQFADREISNTLKIFRSGAES